MLTLIPVNLLTERWEQEIRVRYGQRSVSIQNGKGRGAEEGKILFTPEFSDPQLLREASAAACRTVAEEGIVLLKNEDSALPLRAGARISVFGRAAADPYFGDVSGGAYYGTKKDGGLPEDFRTVLGKIGIDENEKDADKWCLIDYDSFVPGLCRHFGKHESVEVLNTLAGILCSLSDYDGMKFAAVSETGSFASAPEEYILLCAELAEFTFYPHICSTYDLGYCFILESGINDLQYFLRYMDFAGYGKDILQAGQGLFTGQGCLIRNSMHHKI